MLTDPSTAPTVLTYTIAQAAKLSGVSEASMRRLIANSDPPPFPVLRIGVRRVIPREAFLRWVRGVAA